MSILIFALIVVIVCAMFVYAAQYISPPEPFGKLIVALIIIIGALVILNRSGLV